MKTLRLASLAGMVASVVMTQLEPSGQQSQPGQQQPGQQQPGQQDPQRQNPGSPTTNPDRTQPPGQQPGQQDPNQPGQLNPNRPGQLLPSPGLRDRNLNTQQRRRLFALDDATMDAQLNETGQRLMRLEAQFAESNQRLLQQLGRARQLSPERRSEAMGELLQEMLQQQAQLQQYLIDLRTTITGDLADSEAPLGEPGQNPGTIDDQRLNPGSPTTNPSSNPGPGTPWVRPGTNPGGTPRTNPGGTPR